MAREWQLTFGSIGEWKYVIAPKVAVREHASDLVFCEDTEDDRPRDEVIETDDGLFYADASEAFSCDDCSCLLSETVYDDKDGMCESCYDDCHTSCINCCDSVHHDDEYSSEGGDSYCQSCYDNEYTRCEACSNELSRDDAYEHDYSIYCGSCVPCDDDGESDVPYDWSGTDDHDDVGSSRKFGVELETSSCSDYGGWLDKDTWGVVEDGSIRGKEFVSAPIYGNDGLRAIEVFCNSASDSGFRVNDSCGFHLHCDLSDTTADNRKAIALAYHYTRELWHDFIDRDRYDTCYSRMNWPKHEGGHKYWGRKECIDGHDHPNTNDRYVWINWQAFAKHSTIEIRSHHATINGREVCNWIKAHTMFIDAVSNMTVGQVTRMFGNEDKKSQMRELSHIWDDADLSDFYTEKHRERCSA